MVLYFNCMYCHERVQSPMHGGVCDKCREFIEALRNHKMNMHANCWCDDCKRGHTILSMLKMGI